MLKEYKVDVAESLKLFGEHEEIVEANLCYNNVFKLVPYVDGLKVAYGYMNMKFDASVYVRHCFFVDEENNKVIDPTIGHIHSVDKFTKYITFKEFDTYDEYFEAIEKEGYYPALEIALNKEEAEAKAEAIEKGYLFIG